MNSVKLLLLAFIAVAVSSTSFAQDVDAIVAKHIEAIGGKDAWKKVNSMSQEGSMNVQGAEVNISMTQLNGKGMRQNISVMGLTGYQIMTPTEGWSFMPFQGQAKPEAIPAELVKESSDQLDIQGNLIDYKEKGHTVEYLGKDDVEGTEAYKLRVTYKSGKAETIFIDPDTYYILRSVAKQKANGQEMEITTNFSDYKKLPEGIVLPMSVSLPFGQMKITRVEVNKPVDESIFKPANN